MPPIVGPGGGAGEVATAACRTGLPLNFFGSTGTAAGAAATGFAADMARTFARSSAFSFSILSSRAITSSSVADRAAPLNETRQSAAHAVPERNLYFIADPQPCRPIQLRGEGKGTVERIPIERFGQPVKEILMPCHKNGTVILPQCSNLTQPRDILTQLRFDYSSPTNGTGGTMTDIVHGAAPGASRVSDAYRWTQLAVGVGAMVMIANYQYGWTFFVPDIQKKFGWDRASIQWAFTLFVIFETWLVPFEGWFVDKYGPRPVVLAGGIFCGAGWAITSYATTLNGYYLGMIIAGIGAGAVYGTCVGNALKWFPDKRGLAAGITAAGFGAGAGLPGA